MGAIGNRTSVVITAAVALAIFSGIGGATAGALITGLQIKDGSVTGRDLRDGSVRGVDVAGLTGGDITDGTLTGSDIRDRSIQAKDIAGVTGQEVVDGSLSVVDFGGTIVGPQGPPGPRGAGPVSDVLPLPYQLLTSGETWVSVPVSPGRYSVQATMKISRATSMSGTGIVEVACAIYVTSPSDQTGVGVNQSITPGWVTPSNWQGIVLPMLAALEVPDGYTEAEVRCYGSLFNYGGISGEGTIMVTRLDD